MILPSKGISPQRSLLAVAFQIVEATDGIPATVGSVWQRLLAYRKRSGINDVITFEWYVLALDVLYALGMVRFSDDLLIVRRASVQEPAVV